MLTEASLTLQIVTGTSLSGVMGTIFSINKDCLLNSAPAGFSKGTFYEQVLFFEEQSTLVLLRTAEAGFLYFI